MMPFLPTPQVEEHLQEVAQQFAQWRQSRPQPRGARIPEAVWAEAVTLAKELSLTRVARVLGLKPQAIKRRRGDASTLARVKPLMPAPTFVEVRAATARPATAEVEVARPDGARLRILYHDVTPALAPLLHTFLEPH
jgi:hypothetical protein